MIHKVKSGFQIDYRTPSGKRVRKTFPTQQEAKAELARRKLAPGEVHDRSLHDLMEFHIEHSMINWKEASKKDWIPRARHFIGWCEKQNISLAREVTRAVALRYTAHVVKTSHGAGIKSRLQAASSLFRTEIEIQDVPCVARNPFTGIKKAGHVRRKRPKLVPLEQLNAFFSVCSEYEYNLFRLQYGGGFRPGELRQLQWRMVQKQGIFVGEHATWEPKTEESEGVVRYNEIIKESLDYFRKQRSGEYIIYSRLVGHNFVFNHFAAARKRAMKQFPQFDWNGFTAHKLRTAYGSHLAERGVPLPHIQRLMRHRDPKTTDWYYINISDSPLDESARMLDTAKDTASRKSRKTAQKRKKKKG